jgi:phosphohistidine swiveling domain-containing protein
MITRRQFSLGAMAMTLLAAVGCKTVSAVFNQSTLAALVTAVGQGIVNLLTFLGNTTAASQVEGYINTAVNDITSWTPGTVATEVINALNDVAAFISAIPGLGAYAALISLAVGTIDSVIALFTQNSPAPPTTAIRPRTVPVVNLPGAPTKASQYESVWNGKCKALNLETVEIK